MITPPSAVYRFFDADDRLLYVGVTQNLGARFKSHARDKQWWPNIARYTLQWHDDRTEALAAELVAIRTERPIHNIMGSVSEPTPEILDLMRVRKKWDQWVERSEVIRAELDAAIVLALNTDGIKVTDVDKLSPYIPRHTLTIARKNGVQPRSGRNVST